MLKTARRSIERRGDKVNFDSNNELRGILDQTDATDAQVEEAVQIN
jgi:hypothetical protein